MKKIKNMCILCIIFFIGISMMGMKAMAKEEVLTDPYAEAPYDESEDPEAAKYLKNAKSHEEGISSYAVTKKYTHADKYSDYIIQNGIDVSQWQGDIDWQAVKKSGIEFVIVRVGCRATSSGLLMEDSVYQENIKGAISAGIPVGVYIYSQAINEEEAIAEADYVLKRINGYDIQLPVVIDYEYDNSLSGRLYKAKLSVQEATDNCLAFCKRVEKAGYDAMVYASKYFLTDVLYADQISKDYQVWLAHYTTQTDYDGSYNYWQYSQEGVVDGITANVVDMNFRYIADEQNAVSWVEYDPDRYGDVKSDVNLRKGAGTDYSILSQVPEGTRILLDGYEKKSGRSWYKTTYNGKTGYVLSDYVKLSYQAYNPSKKGRTTANLYMRSGVGLNYSKKLYIPSGTEVTLYGYYRVTGYDWYYIECNGVKGYVSSKYVERFADTSEWIEYNPDRYGDVKSSVYLRKGPGTTYSALTTIPQSARILLQGYEKNSTGSWYKTTYQGQVGYILSDYVKLSYQSYSPRKTGQTTANLYLRSGVGTSYSKKLYIKSGTKVTLYGYYRVAGYDWYYVNCNGTKGYLSSKYVKRLN